MVESFTLGMVTAFLIRTGTMRALKWPVLSRKSLLYSEPLRIIPELIVGGLALSLFDYLRRVSLEKVLKR